MEVTDRSCALAAICTKCLQHLSKASRCADPLVLVALVDGCKDDKSL